MGNFKDSKIHKNIEPIFRENKHIYIYIYYVVGHSAGGSATLELEKNFPDRKITTVTYNAPVFARRNPFANIFNDDDSKDYSKPLRFTSAWDPLVCLIITQGQHIRHQI